MIRFPTYLLIFFFILFSSIIFGQKISKNITVISDTTLLDSLSIVPSSFRVFNQNKLVNNSFYELNFSEAKLYWKGNKPVNLRVEYICFSFNLSKTYTNKDTSLIQPYFQYKNPFRSDGKQKSEVDLIGINTLNKSGSISRGITVGNRQDLAVNSNFNLQLSGKIGKNINIIASITDNNIPIQPDGNTQQLQDFDKVFIQLFENNWKLIAGDYQTESRDLYFMRYRKKSKGLFYSNHFLRKDSSKISGNIGVAVSRGKYATNIFNGIEGNQGPYKLTGAENEQFILLLSGTEQVFIDGKLLTRGAKNDYIIDYNTAEITFTPKFLITKNKRIEVQFQYSDKNYIRSLIHSEIGIERKNYTSKIHFYSEQDHKNQPLFQTLEENEKILLSSIGNNIQNAFLPKETVISEDEDVVSYRKIDSIGNKIYVYSNNSDTVLYRLSFTNVGTGNGNYVQNGFSSFGKIYQWIKPDTVGGKIIKYGEFEPVVFLITPKKKQLLSFENNFFIGKKTHVKTDISLSNSDVNSFSKNGNKNNYGMGAFFEITNQKNLTKSERPWQLFSSAKMEFTSIHFSSIEKFRAIEFNRNWNLETTPNNIPILLGNMNLKLVKNNTNLTYGFDYLNLSETYSGFKNKLNFEKENKHFTLNFNANYLFSEAETKTNFYRHRAKIEQRFSKFSIGYEDQMENNLFLSADTLLGNSYAFYEGKIYLKNISKTDNFLKLYYGYRTEKNIVNLRLQNSANSHEAGVDYNLISKNKRTKLNGNVAYRKFTPLSTINSAVPENTFLNQTNFSTSFLKKLFRLNTHYSVGSGLEQKREFVYLEVNPGQGIFAWIDYNNNGIKELSEFEIAAFSDQANYMRIFTQSNSYIRTFTNKFSQSVFINPRNILKKNKSKFAKTISKFSSATAYKIDRKTTLENLGSSLNPFQNNISDTNLVTLNNQIRSSVFYNRTGYKYGVEYSFQNNSNKILLSNGFDSRKTISHELNGRYKIKNIILKWRNKLGEKSLTSDYLSGRNYRIDFVSSTPSISFQKTTNFSLDLTYNYQEKNNKLGNDFAVINTSGISTKYNLANNLNFSTSFNYVKIIYRGNENSSLEYEMLEGLKKGNNYTWELLLNKRIAKNLDLTLNYNGRKPEGIKTIHSGMVQIRAFF